MSVAREINGPWLSRETLEVLPEVKREFDLNRDPLIARQIRDLELTETERREDQAGGRGASRTIARSRTPKPAPIIPPPANTQINRVRWLATQRNTAMAQTLPEQPTSHPQRTPARQWELKM